MRIICGGSRCQHAKCLQILGPPLNGDKSSCCTSPHKNRKGSMCDLYTQHWEALLQPPFFEQWLEALSMEPGSFLALQPKWSSAICPTLKRRLEVTSEKPQLRNPMLRLTQLALVNATTKLSYSKTCGGKDALTK
jgi:hypothetical protein